MVQYLNTVVKKLIKQIKSKKSNSQENLKVFQANNNLMTETQNFTSKVKMAYSNFNKISETTSFDVYEASHRLTNERHFIRSLKI